MASPATSTPLPFPAPDAPRGEECSPDAIAHGSATCCVSVHAHSRQNLNLAAVSRCHTHLPAAPSPSRPSTSSAVHTAPDRNATCSKKHGEVAALTTALPTLAAHRPTSRCTYLVPPAPRKSLPGLQEQVDTRQVDGTCAVVEASLGHLRKRSLIGDTTLHGRPALCTSAMCTAVTSTTGSLANASLAAVSQAALPTSQTMEGAASCLKPFGKDSCSLAPRAGTESMPHKMVRDPVSNCTAASRCEHTVTGKGMKWHERSTAGQRLDQRLPSRSFREAGRLPRQAG
jgi:hypothetical protein